MDISYLQPYLIPVLLVGYIAWRFLKFRQVRSRIPSLIKQGAVVVDVRTRGEYSSGAREGSINIPLDELEKEASRLNHEYPIILCCASGTRSAMAATLLKRKGFRSVVNAGPWRNTVG